ncbi:MAG TPA: DUF2071 domain-containing protein [Candidatus Limnocylindrales bacterium]
MTAGVVARPGRVLLSMRWLDLLFAHWPIDVGELRARIPPPLQLDTFGGTAWLGVVPFRMTHVRPFGLPLPGEAFAFAEVNVRTYVSAPDGTRGIWFLSLDGAHRPSATAARLGFGVPYHHARVMASDDGEWLTERCRCMHSRPAELAIRYRPVGPVAPAAAGSLEAFLTDRLSLFAVQRGRVTETRVEHAPWPLQDAEAEIERNTMTAPFGITLPSTAPHLRFARRLDTVAHRPRTVAR